MICLVGWLDVGAGKGAAILIMGAALDGDVARAQCGVVVALILVM